MKRDLLDDVISEIRDEQIDPAMVENAAARVRARILTPAADDAGLHRIRGCADFQALMPAYLKVDLSPARSLLLEDHMNSCVRCRHAFEAARTGKVRTLPRPFLVEKRMPTEWKWAAAAVVAMAAGLSGWGLYRGLAPAPGSRAVVKSVSGTLYAVADRGSAPIFAGREIGEHQPVRTFESSDAVLRLTDGSEVEMNARSEVWIGRASRETTIHLTHGSIIVHAAKQREGALHVATSDCLVSVKGTIFAVTEGLKGSRVSVVQGAVQVKQGPQTVLLHPGEQVTTSPAVAKTDVRDEISWSRDSTQYLALLGEFSIMSKQLAATPQPALRYSSKVAEFAPPNTIVYASIPNIGPLLSEANRIFDERLTESPLLAQWWSQHHAADGPSLDDLVQRMRTFSDYLGDEVVLAVTMDQNSKTAVPLLMAEVKRPGIADFLKSQAQQINSAAGKQTFTVLDRLTPPPPAGEDHVLAYISGNYLFVSTAIEPLTQADAAVQGSGPRGAYKLYSRLQQSYQDGAGWLLAADMEQIRATSVPSHEGSQAMQQQMAATGIDSLDAIVLERKDVNGKTQSLASLSFSNGRSGMAGWMAAPGSIGSLDFVSPDASMTAAATIQDHGGILYDMIHTAEGADPGLSSRIQQFEQNNGWVIVQALANSLGGDFTFAVDGPLLPVPSWKLAIEVYNPSTCEWAIEQLVKGLNQQPNAPVQLQLTNADVNGRTFYTLSASGIPVQIHYVFVDNYLLAAASQDLLTQAIQNRQTGYTLRQADSFRSLLPSDGNIDVSAILYYNTAPALNALSSGLNATNALSASQKQSIAALAASAKPGLVYAYGQPNRIIVSSSGSFFGLNLDMLSIPAILKGSVGPQLMAGVQHK